MSAAFSRLAVMCTGLLVFTVGAGAVPVLGFDHMVTLQRFLFELIWAVLQFRLLRTVVRFILAPNTPALRLIRFSDQGARNVAQFVQYVGVAVLGVQFILSFLEHEGVHEVIICGTAVALGALVNLWLLGRFWRARRPIAEAFLNGRSLDELSDTARNFANSWPFVFAVWLLFVWAMWAYNIMLGRWDVAHELSLAWYLTVLFPATDRVFYGIAYQVHHIRSLQSPRYEQRVTRFIANVQMGFRVLLVGMALSLVLQGWGVVAGDMLAQAAQSAFAERLLSLLMVMILAYVAWEFVHALVERKLPEEPDAFAQLEGESGGAGASRSETLLPLVRAFLSSVLVVVIVMSALSTMGVNLAPLLASAGIVGIAIGFGAQKLVQDILSGIFFLIDDAFRKGEYIEIEALRGTVERISLRSMQLRHHLGAVQTIPYGEVKTVTNLSRDWITMKLELRLPYDTDIEKVRKIVKKVGQQLLEHPEFGEKFILPLKSQGVMRMEESALIVRMKFTCIPGEQWVIRREAYRHVRDALSAQGIHFAHREVRVRLPEDVENQLRHQQAVGLSSEPQASPVLLQKAGAAAVSAMLAQEAQDAIKHAKHDDFDRGSEM